MDEVTEDESKGSRYYYAKPEEIVDIAHVPLNMMLNFRGKIIDLKH